MYEKEKKEKKYFTIPCANRKCRKPIKVTSLRHYYCADCLRERINKSSRNSMRRKNKYQNKYKSKYGAQHEPL